MTSRVALITGTSSGIGYASARAFVQAGFVTYATARQPERIADLATLGCRTLALDVTNEASMAAAVHTIEQEHGAIDVLVNNAGYGLNGPVEELDSDVIRQAFETNVFGLVRMSQLVLPQMRHKRQGRIINISSVGGTFTAPGSGAYHATKYAVEAFSDALRMEARAFGIRVVVVQPTGAITPFFDRIAHSYPADVAGQPYKRFKQQHAKVVQSMAAQPQRFGLVTADQVAHVILRAAQSSNPRSRYIAGVSGYMYAALRRMLPDRLWDRVMLQQFPVQP